MNFQKTKGIVLKELNLSLSKVDEKEVESFINLLLEAKRVFVMGAGRSMLMIQAFAKRLRHLGIESYVVGETTIPAIGEKGLLVTASGSGETLTTINISKLAKKARAKVALITSSGHSTLKEIADISVRISCPIKLHLSDELPSRQLMASLFEQSLLIFCDSISIMLKERLNISEEDMRKRHSNLE